MILIGWMDFFLWNYACKINWLVACIKDTDLFDIVNSRFERDRDHARLQGRGLDWFSRSGFRLHTHRELVGNFTTCTSSNNLTDFLVNTCQNMYKITINLCPSFCWCFYKRLFWFRLLSYFTKKKKEASRLANFPELKFLPGNVGNESVISPFRIRELHFVPDFSYLCTNACFK